MKRQPGIETAEKLSALQRALNIKTKKMKELAAQINMYQAKVNIFIFRQTNLSMTSKKLKKKYKKSKESITNRKKDKLLQKKINKYLCKFDFIHFLFRKYLFIHLLLNCFIARYSSAGPNFKRNQENLKLLL